MKGSHRHISALLAFLLLLGCQPAQNGYKGYVCHMVSECPDYQHYLEFQNEHLCYCDLVLMSDKFWPACVDESLAARAAASWTVDEDDFLNYVLPVRVGTGPVDAFRLAYADSLLAEVAFMDAGAAVHRINEWIMERVMYKNPCAVRAPLEMLAKGEGDCIGMAELAVTAFRTVGLPARMVYCNWKKGGGHAWAEVKVDGEWYSFGPSEYVVVLGANWVNYSMHLASDVWRLDIDGLKVDAKPDYPVIPNKDPTQEQKDCRARRELELGAMYNARRSVWQENPLLVAYADSFVLEKSLDAAVIRKNIIATLKGSVTTLDDLHEWTKKNIRIVADASSQRFMIPPQVAWVRRTCNIRSRKMLEDYIASCLVISE